MSQWFFTSDLHGQSSLYEQLLELVATHRPGVVGIGGDLGPHAAGEQGVLDQRLFLQGSLLEFARRLREASPESELILLMGNDDWSANQDCLDAYHGELWHALHGRAAVLDDHPVAALSWVPITPFAIKDWERWEDGEEERPARLEGLVSTNDGIEPHRFDPARREPTIAQALAESAAMTPASETIWLFHSPPRDTLCDVTNARAHVGSRAIRTFIEKHQPPLVLSGHIHESPRVSNAYRDTIGRTVVVNPGQFGHPRLSGVWFDPGRPGETLRHTVYG